jgi:hypothetical protein
VMENIVTTGLCNVDKLIIYIYIYIYISLTEGPLCKCYVDITV